MNKIRRAVAVGVAAGALVVPLAMPATAQEAPGLPPGISVVAEGFAGPLQNDVGPNGALYVADAFAGNVQTIDKKGRRSVVWQAAPGTFSPGIGLHGGQLFVTASSEEATATHPYGRADLLRISQGGKVTKVVDLMAYELRVNPDGQTPGPDDAVSNPYDVLALPGRILVADAGGNSVLQVDAAGRISTFAVLPVSRTGACATWPNNSPDGFGCDPVPTGIAMGPDGFVYVSGLGAEVEGHVWKLHPRTGALVESWSGFLPLTGIAAGPDGSLYVSGIDFSSPEEMPEGGVFRLAAGTRDVVGVAPVPVPLGLTFANGRIYAGSFAGVVFAVEPEAFQAP